MNRLSLLMALLAAALSAQPKPEFWPGTTYDSAVPTFEKVLGYGPGERISSHANIVKYMETLAGAQPMRMKLWDYGKTWEGRRLIYAAVSSEKNIARLDEIKAAMHKLADPRKTTDAEAKRIMDGLPAIIWLGYGVHGNEISSPDAALMTAYHLLAARGDKMIDDVLSKVVVMINPLQNPDGRDRFVHNFEVAEGLEPDPNQLAAEHNEPWPVGRTNHYYFDLNRDWLSITQPETKGHIAALLDWLPLVFVDLHEMGSESTYYFAPEADPFNPHLVKEQRTSLYWFGKNNAKYFDQFGYSYFTRENYDAFYPGYGASWPSYYGGIAMTYENGSTRGLIVKKSDDSIVTYRDTVRRHFVTSIGTCETSAVHQTELISNFWKYRKTAIEEGTKEPIREYILPRRGNVTQVDRLAQLLAFQGVELKQATAAFKAANGAEYPAGTYTIPMAQPAKRLVRTLLDPVVSMDDAFLKGEEHRRQRRLPTEIYDVTAWSLPLQFNVDAIQSSAVSQGSFEDVKYGVWPKAAAPAPATVAYLVPWGPSAAAQFLTAALRADLKVWTTDKAFTQNGRKFVAGTLIVKVKEHADSIHATVTKIAAETGAEVVATDTSWVEDGPNFGSQNVVRLKRPVIAMAWDRPTSANSAGQTRFVLERQFHYPVTIVRTDQLANADLTQFHVIILPDGGFGAGYASTLGTGGTQKLKSWVQAGGTLIALGPGAVGYLADARTGMLSVQQELKAKPGDAAAKPPSTGSGAPSGSAPGSAAPPADPRVPGKLLATEADYEKAVQADSDSLDSAKGFLAKVKIDQEVWISQGVPEFTYVPVSGTTVYTPLKADKGINAAIYAGPGEVLASGYLWDEYRKQLAYKPYLMMQRDGRGVVVAFASDPNFRAYLDGLNVLFLNAVFRGPAHGGRVFGAEE